MNFRRGFMEFRSRLYRCHGELEGSMSAEMPVYQQNQYYYRRRRPCP
jgi:hypothetical protein